MVEVQKKGGIPGQGEKPGPQGRGVKFPSSSIKRKKVRCCSHSLEVDPGATMLPPPHISTPTFIV